MNLGDFILLFCLVTLAWNLGYYARKWWRERFRRPSVRLNPPAVGMTRAPGEHPAELWEQKGSLDRAESAYREAAAPYLGKFPPALKHLPDPPCEVEG